MSYSWHDPERLLAGAQPSENSLFAADVRRRRTQSVTITRRDPFDELMDPEHLITVFRWQKAIGGLGAGSDGVRYEDVSIAEAGTTFRQLSRAIHHRTYRPQPARQVEIPKPDGGTRVLSIRSIFDRAIARAVVEFLTPAAEAILLDGCHGCRPARGVWTLLADLVHAVNAGFTTVGQADVRRAFDTVPVDRAIAAFAAVTPDDKFCWLVETLLRGAEGANRRVGLDQGCPMSPMALNLLLNDALDRPLNEAAAGSNIRWFRYVDNYYVTATCTTQSQYALGHIRTLLQTTNMSTKPNSEHVTNLRRNGTRAPVLGFELHGTPPRVQLHRAAFTALAEALDPAHTGPNPAATGEAVVRGWLTAAGPGLGETEREAVLERVRREVRESGLRESLQHAQVADAAEKAYASWRRVLEERVPRETNPQGHAPLY